MALNSGKYRIGPETGLLLVKTRRTGLGRKAGHDLTIEVTRWSGDVLADVSDLSQSWVKVAVEVDSFEVREGLGGLKPLTNSDRAEIKETIRTKILPASEYPVITFASTEVTGTPYAFDVTGELTIMGETQPVTVHVTMENGRLRGNATVTQTTWGITPYSAFLGALRLADEVQVEFDVAEPA